MCSIVVPSRAVINQETHGMMVPARWNHRVDKNPVMQLPYGNSNALSVSYQFAPYVSLDRLDRRDRREPIPYFPIRRRRA